MDIENLILEKIRENKTIKAVDIVKATGFSRAYINRFFRKLEEEGKIVLIGKSNKACYVLADKKNISRAKNSILTVRKILQNKNLSEDLVLDQIKQDTGIFSGLAKNVSDIVSYAFSEILNNAIEHSKSSKIEIKMQKGASDIEFEVRDFGIGIFNNIKRKRKLKSELEAIQNLLKGKQTTNPKEHSGEGIFFTSKAADMLIIQSSRKKLIFNNILDDIFIKDVKKTVGTKVNFRVSLKSKKNLADIFRKYSDRAFSFAKTETKISLYKIDTDFISRSQARRVVSGLDKFKKIVLDFKNVDTVGQAFVDQIFRVWQKTHPDIKIEYRNANKNIRFMIEHAKH